MNERKLRVVLDLNILVSAYFFSKLDAPPRRILQAALDDYFILLHTDDYCADLVAAFSKEKFAERLARISQTPQSLVDIIVNMGEGVLPQEVPSHIVRDADDVVILACAVKGIADYIVTGDQDLLILESYHEVPIVTPAKFLAILSLPTHPTDIDSPKG
jgi:putative PIN family toxin of toxin-antitoxin system